MFGFACSLLVSLLLLAAVAASSEQNPSPLSPSSMTATSSSSSAVTGSSLPPHPLHAGTEASIVDYGADPTGETDSTVAIQSAIDYVHDAGGGIVRVPAGGRFLHGPIHLRSKTYLKVEETAMLMASGDRAAYDTDGWVNGMPVAIQCYNQSETGIVGSGIIDGQAETKFLQYYDPTDERLVPVEWRGPPQHCTEECRPRLVEFVRCSSVLVSDVTLQNSPDWTLHFLGCDNVLAQNLSIKGGFDYPNNDGIDPDSSRDVTIRDIHLDVGDDGVCPKSTRGYGPLRNLLVERITVRSHSSGFKIGSSTQEDMTDILVRDFHVLDGTNRGICIQHRDEGHVRNVHFENIRIDATRQYSSGWWGSGEALSITTIPRNEEVAKNMGTVSDITLNKVTVLKSEHTMYISSRSPYPISNVKIQGLDLHTGNDRRMTVIDQSLLLDDATGATYRPLGFDFRPTFYIDPDTIPCTFLGGTAKCDGIHLENVRDSSISETKVVWTDHVRGECLGMSGSLTDNVVVDSTFVCVIESEETDADA